MQLLVKLVDLIVFIDCKNIYRQKNIKIGVVTKKLLIESIRCIMNNAVRNKKECSFYLNMRTFLEHTVCPTGHVHLGGGNILSKLDKNSWTLYCTRVLSKVADPV